jgi:hypothetical protein
MSRAPRIEFEGALYRVMTRGNRRAIVRVPSVARRLPELVIEFEGWTRRSLFDDNCDLDEQCVAD